MDDTSGFLQIVSVTDDSPAFGRLLPGQILTGIRVGKNSAPLSILVRTKPSEIARRSVHDAYIALQGRLFELIQSERPLLFMTSAGQEISVLAANKTPVSAIPGLFWFLFMIGLAGIVSATLVCLYRPDVPGAWLLLGATFSSFSLHTVFAIIAAKEIAFPAATMEWLTLAELVLIHVFVMFLFSILASYPYRLLSGEILAGYAGVNALLVAAYYFRWFEIPVHQFYFPFILPFLISIGLSHWQWKRSHQQALNRAAVLLMQLSVLVPSALAVLLYILPLMLQQPPIMDAISLRLVEVSLFIGCAMAILQFRLFVVEYWWFKSWLWLLGGAIVILLDMLLFGLLQIPQVYALGLSVVLAGFMYFPLQQWLMGKLMPLDARSLQDFLPSFSAAMANAAAPAEFEQSWQTVLRARFSPANLSDLSAQTGTVPAPQLSGNGLHLQVPALGMNRTYQLTGKQTASRLFNKTDVQTVSALLAIARLAYAASESREQAVLAERKRLLHDLHKTVGQQIQTLAARLPDAQQRKAAEATLQVLDETVRFALPGASLRLVDHLAEWQAETAQRVHLAGAELSWLADYTLAQQELSLRQLLEIAQFVREAVSNALKHASPARLVVSFLRQERVLQIRIDNDGDISPPRHWQPGTGMKSMEARINALNGELQIRHQRQEGILSIRAIVPI